MTKKVKKYSERAIFSFDFLSNIIKLKQKMFIF